MSIRDSSGRMLEAAVDRLAAAPLAAQEHLRVAVVEDGLAGRAGDAGEAQARDEGEQQ
jgi:hypothetical protein